MQIFSSIKILIKIQFIYTFYACKKSIMHIIHSKRSSITAIIHAAYTGYTVNSGMRHRSACRGCTTSHCCYCYCYC